MHLSAGDSQSTEKLGCACKSHFLHGHWPIWVTAISLDWQKLSRVSGEIPSQGPPENIWSGNSRDWTRGASAFQAYPPNVQNLFQIHLSYIPSFTKVCQQQTSGSKWIETSCANSDEENCGGFWSADRTHSLKQARPNATYVYLAIRPLISAVRGAHLYLYSLIVCMLTQKEAHWLK